MPWSIKHNDGSNVTGVTSSVSESYASLTFDPHTDKKKNVYVVTYTTPDGTCSRDMTFVVSNACDEDCVPFLDSCVEARDNLKDYDIQLDPVAGDSTTDSILPRKNLFWSGSQDIQITPISYAYNPLDQNTWLETPPSITYNRISDHVRYTAKEANTTGSDRYCTITWKLVYNNMDSQVDGELCDEVVVVVKQTSGSGGGPGPNPCQTYTITPDQAPDYTGGRIQFTTGGTTGGGGTPSTPTPTPGGCSPTSDSTLDTYISNISNGIGTTINATNTPCTYTYLQDAYNYVKSQTSKATTISFMLANVLAELTPVNTMAEKYFVNAATKYGGINLSFSDSANVAIYEERTLGGLQYAKYRGNLYSTKFDMAKEARTELVGKGVSSAVMRPRLYPTNSNPIYFYQADSVDMRKIIPSSSPSNTGSDVSDIQSLINTYTSSTASNATQAIKDKNLCAKYVCNRMGITDSNQIQFIDYARDVADAGSNRVKVDTNYARYRPIAAYNHGDVSFTIPSGGDAYLCNFQTEYVSVNTCYAADGSPSETTYCANNIAEFTDPSSPLGNYKKSFPSGHSSRAYMMMLAAVEMRGDNGKSATIDDYCRNRNVVRAHWKTDVIAGKLCASMQIGYLNGFEEYDKLIRNV